MEQKKTSKTQRDEKKTNPLKKAPAKNEKTPSTKSIKNSPVTKKKVSTPAVPMESKEDNTVFHDCGFISDYDVYLFREGNHYSLYEKFGSHPCRHNGRDGVFFAVWAPNAKKVSVIGDFNYWSPGRHPLKAREDESGLWTAFVPDIGSGTVYKYHITSNFNKYTVEKADPFARYNEIPPKTGSIVWKDKYSWQDGDWMKNRKENNSLSSPMSVYELHPESWRKVPEEGNRYLTYRELALQLADYIQEMEFTHVELLPVMEHPFSGSWGYQVLGYFSPTSRFGDPDDFKYFVDLLHQRNIGVILDWVPSHFPGDLHGLHFFDGTYLYEHGDPRLGYHPDWSSYIFNYGRNEVKEFLISSAHFWLSNFHIDGIRVDAVASMLYLDYSRKEGEWIPNEHGGRENLAAIQFLKDLNQSVYGSFPDVQVIAEESTSWPMVTRPIYTGGLGFGMKWNMGWMHDTLDYFSQDPMYRTYHHNKLTFSIWYAFSENFMLSISHDEVVHGKGSLINKMPGDGWQKFANLRLLFGYMYAHPGKKLIFMGSEFGQWKEWNHQQSLDWNLLDYDTHQGLKQWVRDLNHVYKRTPALYECDFNKEGFKWIDANDSKNSILSFVRYDKSKKNPVIVFCNFTPIPLSNYRAGVPLEGHWNELLNSDAKEYGGSGQGNFGGVESFPVPYHHEDNSINVNIPPLGVVVFQVQSD